MSNGLKKKMKINKKGGITNSGSYYAVYTIRCFTVSGSIHFHYVMKICFF